MLVPRAQLKVFSPVESFPPRERERWRAYIEQGHGLSRRQVAEAESGASVTRLVSGRSRLGPDAALVRRAGRRSLICPIDLDLRAAVALEDFKRTIPPSLVRAFLPDPSSLDRYAAMSASGRQPHVLDEAWAVPLPWFVAFTADERRFRDPPEGAGPRVAYLTMVDQALERLDHAIDVVDATVDDGDDVLDALSQLAGWLQGFDPESLLELDYGGVARTFPRDELEADHSCEELWRAISALEAGDLLGAAAAYGVARSRWSDRRAKQHAS